jgi:hypothetical protein
MRNLSRIGFFLLTGFLSVGAAKAHIVDWWPENPLGGAPANPMVFYYPNELSGRFYVDPSYLEPCTVYVNLNASTSSLVNAQVITATPANSVTIVVQILRSPSNHVETATITGEWHASGFPLGFGCDAVSPNPFSVPITVTDQTPPFRITSINTSWVSLSGPNRALQSSSCLTGPWATLGVGQTIVIRKMMPSAFFRQTKQVGNFVAGYLMDNTSWAVPNDKVGLEYGGATATSDSSGSFTLPRMPVGFNWLSISNQIGANLNIGITNKDTAPTNAFTAVTVKVAAAAAPIAPPTNVCNCTPWCSIGFATTPDGQTPIYYAGGANSPSSGTPDCGAPVVTVTPPVGPSFTISAGTDHHHNSGPNPASGTWTVTAVVCGLTKTATITVP